MGNDRGIGALCLLLLQIVLGARAWRNYRSLPALSEHPSGTDSMPSVSIIIPARNEEGNLPRLLSSLLQLDYPDYEIIVVDDESSDRTAELARRHGVRVIESGRMPSGWVGKSWACAQGAAAARGSLLLFTDADTEHSPASLRAAVTSAVSRRLSLLSVMPAQECGTFWERLLLPYAFALYFAGLTRVNGPRGDSVANGQYLLFNRREYDRLGGHGCVRGSLIEDVELARLTKRAGGSVALYRTTSIRVRMYTGLRPLWEGFGKNAFRFVSSSPRSGALTVLATITYAGAVPNAIRTRNRSLSLALLATPAVALSPWTRDAGVPAAYALLYPFAGLTFGGIALDSAQRSISRRRTVWKDRRY